MSKVTQLTTVQGRALNPGLLHSQAQFFFLPHMCQLAIKTESLYMQYGALDWILDQHKEHY